jgi:hypothetical protein
MGDEQPFEIKLASAKVKPGGVVKGTVMPLGDLSKARGLEISLAFREGTKNLIHFERYGEPIAVAGGLASGQEVPFEFELPADAVPGHETPGAIIGWVVWVNADLRGREDIKGFEWVEVAAGQEPAEPFHSLAHEGKTLFKSKVSPIPAAGAAEWEDTRGGLARKFSKHSRWDAGLAIDRSHLRRGEKLTATVTLGEPDPGRKPLRVGVRCAKFVALYRGGDDEDSGVRVHGHPNAEGTVGDWATLDPASAEQQVELSVPEDGPFSFGGEYVLLQWEAVVQEEPEPNRLYDGAERTLPLWVFP